MLRRYRADSGYLHDSPQAQKTVGRWLEVGGLLADLPALSDERMIILRNVAPVAPRTIFTKIKKAVIAPDADAFIGTTAVNGTYLIRLVKVLAFEAEMFDDAALTLARFVCAQPADSNQSSKPWTALRSCSSSISRALKR